MKKLYTFLFLKHDVGFYRFCVAMLIPCAVWFEVCRVWMLVMAFVQMLVVLAHEKGWNKIQ